MYLEFFSLKRHPFRITPDPALFYPGDEQGRGVILEALIYGITSGEGILKVTGEVGSGKTMLCRMLEERLPLSVEIVYLANPSLSARDIVYAIAFDLKLPVTPDTDRLIVMQKLQEYLLEKHSQGGTVVVFIEEAQGMPLETLEEIRLLSNLETHQHKLLQIVLFGQPELEKILQHKSIRQLRERITHSFELQPLSLEATREYLRFRLQAAGCPWPQLFHPQAEKLLAQVSSGLTRRINILADKSLLAAYADPSVRNDARDGKGQIRSMVLPRHVKTAIHDSRYRSGVPILKPLLVGTGLAATAAGIFALGWYLAPGGPVDREVQYPVQVVDSTAEAPSTDRESGGADQNTQVEDVRLPVTAVSPDVRGVASAQRDEPEAQPDQLRQVIRSSADSAGMTGKQTSEEFVSASTQQVEPAPVMPVDDVEGDFQNQLRQVVRDSEEPPVVSEAVVTPASSVVVDAGDIIAGREQASREWLTSMSERGYTVQLFSGSRTQPQSVREFLSLMESHDLLQEAYFCDLEVPVGDPIDRQVVYGEFTGVSLAREFIDNLPDELSRLSPFVRNIDDLGCSNQP